MDKIWLVTGSGNGLGRDIAEAALTAGDRVVAGTRRLEESGSLVERYAERICPVALDVRDEGDAQAAVRRAVEVCGRLDVLVNNAGYQYNAPFEQITSEKFRDVVETCFFGVVHTTRAALPVMRAQRCGHIFQVSSIGGRVTIPGNSPYHATKWAVGGFSDLLADEVAALGVKVCTLEPGGIRTGFKQRARQELPALWPEYEASVGPIYRMMAAGPQSSDSNPKKIADLVVKLSDAEDVSKRLILGEQAEAYARRVEAARAEEAARHRDLTLATGFPAGTSPGRSDA